MKLFVLFAFLLSSAAAFLPVSVQSQRSNLALSAVKDDSSRRAFGSVVSGLLLGLAAGASGAEAFKMEPKLTYGKLPVPVYGAFDGNKPGTLIQILFCVASDPTMRRK